MDTEQLADKLVSWIRDKVLSGGCRGVVIGLSGGIDSSVLAVLCRRALPEDTLAVMMPCGSNPQDGEHACLVADKFSIPVMEVGLDGVFDAFLQALPDYRVAPKVSRMAQANLKARLRMIALYYIANQLRYLVAGASNRSELATGYFTKHGDGGVDIMPLGGLVKAQVVELAGYLGVPQEIIDKPPSAGLWQGQTDEADMGFSYTALDRYLLTGEASGELRDRIEALLAASGHKRSLPPIADF